MAPKVSIVTCSYNRPALLKAAIDSVRRQSDPDWEHLIYDDCSTDPGVIKVLEWANLDPRVRIWCGHSNRDRPAVLWNFMLDRAHGRYFTVLDDDNEKLPTFVAAMSRELDQHPEVDVVTCGWRVIRPGYRDEDYFLNLSTTAERLAELSTCDGGAMLYRRTTFERVGYFSEAQRTNEDWDWLRRAVHVGQIKNLQEVHSTYLSHAGSRMNYAKALGNDDDVARVKARQLASELRIRAICPDYGRLTASQKDVCTSVQTALGTIPWVTPGEELCLVVSPFQTTDVEIASTATGCKKILSLHMEDPYALEANRARVQVMTRLAETWVCTNDAATVPYYRKLVDDRIIICPSLGFDSTMTTYETQNRDIDVLLCGYPYPSRKKFVRELVRLLGGLRVWLVGDGWRDEGLKDCIYADTQILDNTYQLHARARAVVCLQRVHGDCSDGPVEPLTVNRGFMEGALGPRVFLDGTRPYHSFDEDDVVSYGGPGDLAARLRSYLGRGPTSEASVFAEKCRRLYSYRTRLQRILNCVRAPRVLAEIP